MPRRTSAGSFTSTVLVGHLTGSIEKVAALGLGFVWCNILGFHVLNGLAGAVDTMSSQAFGAGVCSEARTTDTHYQP